ncbi:MAG: glycosyltransferase family 4 protein [Cyanobacteria bacterium P01_G01_bin.38]
MRLLVILYAGDYREAYRRMVSGEPETYIGHRYSVKSLIRIGQQAEEVAVLCCRSEDAYDEFLEPGFRVIGTGYEPEKNMRSLIQTIKDYRPTHVVLRAPMLGVLNWLTQRKINTLVMFADSFLNRSLPAKFKNFLMVRKLNHPCIRWVANHGVNSSCLLQKMGVKTEKIIPWDLPHTKSPRVYQAKHIKTDAHRWNLLYVGSINEKKGVGDILFALLELRRKGINTQLKIAGKGHVESFSLQAKRLGIEDAVAFLGLVPNDSVVGRMREADLVLIPSRHEYPEGFPFTIYEALCSRTPIVASDHPMFRGVLIHKVSAMIFTATQPSALADCIQCILEDASLYHQISEASLATWEQLQIPVKWADLIERWLFNSPENDRWLFQHRLVSGKYNDFRAYEAAYLHET